jgi:hypothetical protein
METILKSSRLATRPAPFRLARSAARWLGLALSTLLALATIALWIRSSAAVESAGMRFQPSGSSTWHLDRLGIQSRAGHIELLLSIRPTGAPPITIVPNGRLPPSSASPEPRFYVAHRSLGTRDRIVSRGGGAYEPWHFLGFYHEASLIYLPNNPNRANPDWVFDWYGAPDWFVLALFIAGPILWRARALRRQKSCAHGFPVDRSPDPGNGKTERPGTGTENGRNAETGR